MAWKDQPLDSTIDVVTPENIAFEYRLAGPFRRLPALLFDIFVCRAAQMALFCGIGMSVGMVSQGLAVFLIFLSIFIIDWFYGILFETFLNGQTLGKWVFGLRVLTDRGEPINGMQATLRNLLRSADLLMGIFGTIGITAMAMNRRYQRLGDLVAGTIVVVEERRWLTGVAKLDDPRAIQLAAYLPPNFVVSRSLSKALSTYVERRRFFTPPRRREVARHLAEPLLERFGLPPDTSYDLLLCSLYYRTFIADRSQDERLLAEAQAAFAAANPFAAFAGGRGMSASPYPGMPNSAGITFVNPPAPLPQEQMVGTGFGAGR
ncbi:MAG TPA: RDD family protein [Pirellulaceae bacterium]|nr:RDD family protein [Pirellulaceae bacterium]